MGKKEATQRDVIAVMRDNMQRLSNESVTEDADFQFLSGWKHSRGSLGKLSWSTSQLGLYVDVCMGITSSPRIRYNHATHILITRSHCDFKIFCNMLIIVM